MYAIDAARWLLGDFCRVSGNLETYINRRPVLTGRHNFDQVVRLVADKTLPIEHETGLVENEDDCTFLGTFSSGAYGVFWASRLHQEQRLVVYGSDRTLIWRLAGDRLSGRQGRQAAFVGLAVPKALPRTIVSQFVRGVRCGDELPPNFHDGVKAQEVMEAVTRSAQEGQWVHVGQLASNQSHIVL